MLALVREHVALRRVGTRFIGLCPFHSESTPSFSVNPALGVYYCFGCHASGDAISFVRQVEHLDFQEAVELLAQRAGVTIARESAGESEKRRETRKIREVLEAAIAFYRTHLDTSTEGREARGYLASRGISSEIEERFQIGLAPMDAGRLFSHLKVSPALFVAAGLGYEAGGRARDMFAGRIVFPIFDASGNPVAFGGRVIPGRSYPGEGEPPKYKNSPETDYYHKRRTLYGLNWAKADIVRGDRAVICEGYTDVIAFHGSGIPIAVATCGTALTEDHLDRLKNFTKNVILAFDGDKAGVNATERIYEWERKFKLNVKVAGFPEGEDPASLAQKDPAILAACVEGAQPFMAFRLDRHFAAADLSSIEARFTASSEALAIIAEHPDQLVRGEYVMQVADRCRLDFRELERRLEAEVRRARARNRAVAKGEAPEPAPPEPDDLEPMNPRPAANPPRFSLAELLDSSQRPYNEAIRQLAARPGELSAFMPEFLFAHPVHLELVRSLGTCTTPDEVVESAEGLSAAARGLLMRLLIDPSNEDEVDVISRLVERHADRAVDSLMREVRRVDGAGSLAPERAIAISESLSYIRKWQGRLREAETRDEAVGVLLAHFADGLQEDQTAGEAKGSLA